MVADAVNCNVIASGGISSIADIKSIRELNKDNITGIIVGKALYEGAFTLREANEAVAGVDNGMD